MPTKEIALNFNVRLSKGDIAGINALCELFPNMNQEYLLGEILSAAIDDLTGLFPYISGHNNVTYKDSLGDPVFADVGFTPKFLDVKRKYLSKP